MGPVRFSAGMAASCICRGDEQGVGGRRLASAEERKTNKLLARRGESLKSSSETESLLKTEDVTWVSVLELPTCLPTPRLSRGFNGYPRHSQQRARGVAIRAALDPRNQSGPVPSQQQQRQVPELGWQRMAAGLTSPERHPACRRGGIPGSQ